MTYPVWQIMRRDTFSYVRDARSNVSFATYAEARSFMELYGLDRFEYRITLRYKLKVNVGQTMLTKKWQKR